jgi:uncharacterized protein
MTKLRVVMLTALIAVVAGCMSQRERRRVYALDSALDISNSAATPLAGPALQLQRVLVPDYLDSTGLLLRVGAHEIRESYTARFGERLSLGITHTLRSDLAARLPLNSVALAEPADRSAWQILVTVDTFDVWQDGRCALAANWSILGIDRRAVMAAGHAVLIIAPASDSPNDAAIVAAMADAVSQLAGRIASTINSLSP